MPRSICRDFRGSPTPTSKKGGPQTGISITRAEAGFTAAERARASGGTDVTFMSSKEYPFGSAPGLNWTLSEFPTNRPRRWAPGNCELHPGGRLMGMFAPSRSKSRKMPEALEGPAGGECGNMPVALPPIVRSACGCWRHGHQYRELGGHLRLNNPYLTSTSTKLEGPERAIHKPPYHGKKVAVPSLPSNACRNHGGNSALMHAVF